MARARRRRGWSRVTLGNARRLSGWCGRWLRGGRGAGAVVVDGGARAVDGVFAADAMRGVGARVIGDGAAAGLPRRT
ncbi:hypothetical protein FGB62_49g224 [Gracilaria domingensis]|nr:hypothetical protein FGB62_49g224 [Gracilaria domingensis]